jgi:hypothetical protein
VVEREANTNTSSSSSASTLLLLLLSLLLHGGCVTVIEARLHHRVAQGYSIHTSTSVSISTSISVSTSISTSIGSHLFLDIHRDAEVRVLKQPLRTQQ